MKKKEVKKKVTVLYAKFMEIEQMYDTGTRKQNENFMLVFFAHSGLNIPIIISNKLTKASDKNPNGISRLEQLEFFKNGGEKGTFNPEDYVKLKVYQRVEGKTQYVDKEGKPVLHKSSGFEIVSIEKSDKDTFEEQFSFFISTHLEDEIKALIKEGWDYETSIKHLKNKLRVAK